MATESSNIKNMSPSFDQNGVPLMLNWTTHDVSNWIRDEVGFPQYQECFRANFIDGRQLINIDASSLPRIGVTDFEHVKVIAKRIRQLLGIEEPFWNRPITLPPRDAVAHYLERKSHTGSESDGLTFGEHMRYLKRYSTHGDDDL